MIDSAAIVMIEHEALRSNGSSLDHLARAAGDEEQQHMWTGETRRQPQSAAFDIVNPPKIIRRELLAVPFREKHGEEFLARGDIRHRSRGFSRRDRHSIAPQPFRLLR